MNDKLKIALGCILIVLSLTVCVAAIPVAIFFPPTYSAYASGAVFVISLLLMKFSFKIFPNKKLKLKLDEFKFNYDAYRNFETTLSTTLERKFYKLYSKMNIFADVSLTVYIREITASKICCFAVCHGAKIQESDFEQTKKIIQDVLGDYNTRVSFFGENRLELFHCIILFCQEEPSEYFNDIKNTAFHMFVKQDFGEEYGRYALGLKKCGILYTSAALYEKKIFVPRLNPWLDGNKCLYKTYVKELCEILNLEEPLNPKKKTKQ